MSVITEVMDGLKTPGVALHHQILEAPFDSATVYTTNKYHAVRLGLADKVFDVHLFDMTESIGEVSPRAQSEICEAMVTLAVAIMRRHRD